MNGIVVVNKPAGLSSARAVARVKRLLQARKAGHTGTLDPFARGVLVCCINQATRLARFLLESPKTYEGVLTLGVETDTQDATGRVIAERDGTAVAEEDLHCESFNATKALTTRRRRCTRPSSTRGVPLYTLVRRGPAGSEAGPVGFHLPPPGVGGRAAPRAIRGALLRRNLYPHPVCGHRPRRWDAAVI